jgi:GYF domain 2/Domain of Unknown Function with PDB structure (DUF3862)
LARGNFLVVDAWYYSDKDGQAGPLTLQELKERLAILSNANDVLVWRYGFSGWKPANDVAELNGQTTMPPPIPHSETSEAENESERSKRSAPVVGIVATGFGLASVFTPYFAAVFFAPAALICGVIALIRRQTGWGIAGLLLGLLGFAGIAYTSEQIMGIFNGEAGRVSLPTPAFAPPPVVTRQKYDQIHEGMTYQQVRNIIGSSGEELSESDIAGMTTVMYSWTNSNASIMNAMFQNDRLISKSQFGLP